MTDGRRKVSFKVSVQAIKQSSEATRPAAAAGRANFFGPERAPLDLASFAWSIVSRAKERTFCNLRTLNVINKSCSRKRKKRSRLAFFWNWRADYYGATIFTYRLCGRKEAPSFASTKLSYESLMTREREREAEELIDVSRLRLKHVPPASCFCPFDRIKEPWSFQYRLNDATVSAAHERTHASGTCPSPVSLNEWCG